MFISMPVNTMALGVFDIANEKLSAISRATSSSFYHNQISEELVKAFSVKFANYKICCLI